MDNNNKEVSGSLKISDEVVTTIAKVAVSEVEGIAGLAEPIVNLKMLLIKDDKPQSIRVKLNGDVVEIQVFVIVKAGVKINTAAEKLQNRIKADVQGMTGITVSRVDVVVAGVIYPEDEQADTAENKTE